MNCRRPQTAADGQCRRVLRFRNMFYFNDICYCRRCRRVIINKYISTIKL